MLLFSTRQKLTKIFWYKYFGANFTKAVRQGTGPKSTGLVSPACFNAGRTIKFAPGKSLRFFELFLELSHFEFRFTVFFILGCGVDS